MRTVLLTTAILTGFATLTAAQVVTSSDTGEDKSTTHTEIQIITRDRDTVPLTVETRQTQTEPNIIHTESVTRARLGDGSYFDWRSASRTKRELDDGAVEWSTEIVERDRQGGLRESKRITERLIKTGDGEQAVIQSYRRNSSGRQVLDAATTRTTTLYDDGRSQSVIVEQRADVAGKLRAVKEIEQTTVTLSPGNEDTTNLIKTFNHLEGGFGVTGREQISTRKDGETTRVETVRQKPSGTGWDPETRTVTVETIAPDGTRQRETIHERRSLYARKTGASSDVEPLVPKEKVVEREVRRADGRVAVEREVYRRDVNGNWKPVTFSTEAVQNVY